MKAKLLLGVFILFYLLACTKTEDGMYMKSVSYSDCLSGKLRSDSDTTDENSSGKTWLTYETTADHGLKIVLHRVFMNCGVEKVTADLRLVSNDTVEIHLSSEGGENLNCLCPMDITQVVGNLEEGATYHFSVFQFYQECASFEIRNFSPGLTGSADFQ